MAPLMTADGACDNCGASPEKYTNSPSPPTSLVGQLMPKHESRMGQQSQDQFPRKHEYNKTKPLKDPVLLVCRQRRAPANGKEGLQFFRRHSARIGEAGALRKCGVGMCRLNTA